MNIVTPESKTTLLLNGSFQGFAFCTARACIRHLITGRGKGIDATGNPIGWDTEGIPWDWHGNQVELYEDQPCLRSAPNNLTGDSTEHAIPTIMLCTHHFGFRKKAGMTISLRTLYNAQNGICQYCLEKIPYSQATKDHIYPKSKGGSNDDFNIALACKKCNNAKDSNYPHYDIHGKEVKPVKLGGYHSFVPEGLVIRDEWKGFLFME